jgi:D-beta-D-heptose 7-phosphate kinase/D-beta-D-heptose 1-phosphate adenosyltransferase
LAKAIPAASAVIVSDYNKGLLTQPVLEAVKSLCQKHGAWLSLDPKPAHDLKIKGVSLVTPNRKEAFALAGIADKTHNKNPLLDANLLMVAQNLLEVFQPRVLLITLGELGMLLCQPDQAPTHIPTAAQEVFDVSGAGDTVIAAFTLAVAAGASPLEAALISNCTAGIVVGKVGTATALPEELLARIAS